MFDVGRSMFISFFYRSDWPLFRPEARLVWNYIGFDRITGLTGFFCFAGLYPVDPVDPVRIRNRQNSLL